MLNYLLLRNIWRCTVINFFLKKNIKGQTRETASGWVLMDHNRNRMLLSQP